ncbi:alpha/beta hydrolase [Glutamicibacter mysorens]|nr:alpha/beta hydrolase [Glutamicibacter mysorens]UTM45841.1 alpha/beta hydrolase [Glutamicibacter mysorens]
MRSDGNLAYEDLGTAIRLQPVQEPTGPGLIFFPGAKVEPPAYASVLAEAAEHGITVLIAKPPLNIALLQPGSLDDIMELAPDVDSWAVGGHSMGGVKACEYAGDHRVTKLLLFASYCASTEVEDHPGLDVLALYGDRDEVINRQKSKASKTSSRRMPAAPP